MFDITKDESQRIVTAIKAILWDNCEDGPHVLVSKESMLNHFGCSQNELAAQQFEQEVNFQLATKELSKDIGVWKMVPYLDEFWMFVWISNKTSLVLADLEKQGDITVFRGFEQ